MDLFISKQDPRQRPKGTRDPLGFEQIWTSYGRDIIGGLTTITDSLENFIVALIGFYVSQENFPTDSEKKEKCFIRYEELIAYLRIHEEENPNILGIQRAKGFYENDEMLLSDSKQILSSQKSYGLWGLYSTALADVELIENRVLTAKGREFVEKITNKYDKVINKIKKKIQKETKIKKSNLGDYSEQFSKILIDKELRKSLSNILLAKSELYQYVQQDIVVEKNNKILNALDFANNLLQNSRDDKLKQKFKDILRVDKIMLVANKLFDAVRNSGLDAKPLDEFIEHLKKIKFPKLEEPSQFPKKRKNYSAIPKIKTFASYINQKKYKEAIIEILDINKMIMTERNSIAWVSYENDKLKIRQISKSKIDIDEKFEGMDYSYFLYSYLSIAKTLKEN